MSPSSGLLGKELLGVGSNTDMTLIGRDTGASESEQQIGQSRAMDPPSVLLMAAPDRLCS